MNSSGQRSPSKRLCTQPRRGVPRCTPRLFAQGKTVVLERGGRPVGFAVLRRFGRGHAVGPVAAPDFDAARLLLTECCRHTEGFLRIDVDATSGLQQWLESLGLSRTGGGTTMVRGGVPAPGARSRWLGAGHAGDWLTFLRSVYRPADTHNGVVMLRIGRICCGVHGVAIVVRVKCSM